MKITISFAWWAAKAALEVEIADDVAERYRLSAAVQTVVDRIRKGELPRETLTDADFTGADFTGAVLTRAVLTGAVLTGAVLTRAVLTGAVLTGAVLTRADFTGAVLTDADERPFKADLWMVLTQNRDEVRGLIAALREGRVDGSTYNGDCACLVGTIANVRHVAVESLECDANRPAERWFLMIRKGDKPGDASGGGFAAGKAIDWALEWCALNGVVIPDAPAVA